MSTVLGTRSQPTRNEFENSDYVIAWGNNPVVTLCGYFGRIQKMMDNGGTLCTIDPFYSETADKSQEWIQPWPGTDSALALAMLKVVIDEGLTDEEYLIAAHDGALSGGQRHRRPRVRRSGGRHHLPGVGHRDERRGRP